MSTANLYYPPSPSTRSTRLTIFSSVYSVYSRLLGAPLRGSRSLGFLDFVSLSGSNLCVLCVLLDHRSLGEGGCG